MRKAVRFWSWSFILGQRVGGCEAFLVLRNLGIGVGDWAVVAHVFFSRRWRMNTRSSIMAC